MTIIIRLCFLLCFVLVVAVSDAMAAKPHKDKQVKWVLAQLESVNWGEDSPVEAYVADFRARVAEAKAAKTKFGQPGFAPEDLTLHNPAYWRAVETMGDDRVLLWWLHGLLLQHAGRAVESFEWTVMARRGVVLSAEFDARWLEWERELLTWTEAGKLHRIGTAGGSGLALAAYMATSHGPHAAINAPGTLAGVAGGVAGGEVDFSDYRPDLIWHAWRDILQDEWAVLPEDLRRLFILRLGYWPTIPYLAPDELRVLAPWLVETKRPALALVCWLNAAQQDGLSLPEAYEITRSAMLDTTERGEVSPLLGVGTGRYVTPPTDWSPLRPDLHPYLAADAEQTRRRLDGMRPNLANWYIPDMTFFYLLTRYRYLLGDAKGLAKLSNLFTRQEEGAAPRVFIKVRVAQLEGDEKTIAKHGRKLAHRNRKEIKTPRAYVLTSMAQGEWHEATRCYAEEARRVVSRPASVVHAGLQAYATSILAENPNPDLVKDALVVLPLNGDENEQWAKLLAEVMLGRKNREVLVPFMETTFAYVASGRLAEAHLAMGFAPDATPESRRIDLEAVLATGRVDKFEYDLARYALRDLEKGGPQP